MKRNYSTGVTGWLFIAGALMLWGGWVLLPVHMGTFFKPDDFAAVHASIGGSGCTGSTCSAFW